MIIRHNSFTCLFFNQRGSVSGLIGGSGSIGGKVADLSLALGMKVLVFSRNPKPKAGVAVASSLEGE